MEKIILFGQGKYFQTKKNILNCYDVIAIMDSRASGKASLEDTSIPVIHPTALKDGSEKIFLMSMYFVSMWKQLMGQGVAPERLVYPFFKRPYFQSDEIVDRYVDFISFHRDYFVVHEKDGHEDQISTAEQWNAFLRRLYRRAFPIIDAISKMPVAPISRQFATERGTPVDRYYIRQFLGDNKKHISGDVLEIEDNTYTRMIGGDQVSKSIVMDVSAKSEAIDFNANLETGEGICDEIADCFICTQTLMYIYDLEEAVHNIVRMLKLNGVALITCSGLSQNSIRCMDSYGTYWGFTSGDAFRKIFEKENHVKILSSSSYGNCKTVLAHLAGLCVEDLRPEDFSVNDSCYPLVCCAAVQRTA